jgi:hypothetical protein
MPIRYTLDDRRGQKVERETVRSAPSTKQRVEFTYRLG